MIDAASSSAPPLGAIASFSGSPISAAEITNALRDACRPVSHLCYADTTDGHAVAGAADGRAIRADGRDIQALIVSSCFEGRNALQRQQLVNDVLAPHILSGRLHSVQMRCWTPAQWEKLGKPENLGKPCFQLPQEDETLSPAVMGQPLALQSCTAGGPAPPAAALAPPQPVVPETQPPAPAPAPAQPAPPQPQQRPEVTVEMLVTHLQSQGEAGLASARNIMGCDHANALQRRAAALVVAAADDEAAAPPPPAPRVEA